jgi:hypothetical protein
MKGLGRSVLPYFKIAVEKPLDILAIFKKSG